MIFPAVYDRFTLSSPESEQTVLPSCPTCEKNQRHVPFGSRDDDVLALTMQSGLTGLAQIETEAAVAKQFRSFLKNA